MFDEGGNDYGNDVSDDTVFCHSRGDDRDEGNKKNTGTRRTVSRIKTIEILLSAVYTLISAALSVIKFINQINKLKTA